MRIWLVLAILFLDFLAYAAVIPIVPLLLLNTPHSFLPPTISDGSRYLLLGFLLSTYPLAQMFGSPILGFFSDTFRRKTIFLLSYFGNMIGYFLVATGVALASLPLLFLGNLIAGITGGNLSVAFTMFSESQEKKIRYYSLSHLMIGCAFLFGPLCSQQLLSIAHPYVLFLGCGAMGFMNCLLIAMFLKEPAKPFYPYTLKQMVTHFKELAIERKELRALLTALFFFFFGWYFFIKVFQVFIIHQTHLQSSGFFSILAYFGSCCILTQAFFSVFLFKWIAPRRLIPLSLLLLGGSLFSFLFTYNLLSTLIAVTFFSVAYSLLCPAFIAVISEAGSSDEQGRLMGVHQSIQSCAKIFGPLIAAATMAFAPTTPVWISCSSVLASSVVFIFWAKRYASRTLETARVQHETTQDLLGSSHTHS